MKRIFFLALLMLVCAVPAAAEVGVSISVGQPGFYGRLDIGDFPAPQVIYPEPLIVAPPRAAVAPPPLYLRVPPGHEKKWSKHCRKYNACGRPVYFVRHDWYNKVYVPEYRARHGRGGHGDSRGNKREKQGSRGRGNGHDKD